ncbi:MAG: amidohydrolase family protein [Bacteroidetes bacterium]|nr:amidohydrolase family protein [Bacteroidota bacterium]
MQFFQADLLYTVSNGVIPNGIVVVENDGTVIEVLQEDKFFGDKTKISKYKGAICPGFVNTHCHLELSYLKGLIKPQTGLDTFIQQLTEVRNNFTTEQIMLAIENASAEMHANGIVAVGDISNTNHSFACKRNDKIHYHTFIELYGFHPNRAEAAFSHGMQLYDFYKKNISEHVSITPHAPYSLSRKLMEKINQIDNKLLTIHNQESENENLFFKEKQGAVLDRLHAFGIETDFWKATGKSSLQSILPLFKKGSNLLLVHNTFTSKEDIAWALHNWEMEQLFWCFCPKANLYIENKLPDFTLFLEGNAQITIGTDSLASNNGLSIFEEIKTIQNAIPSVSLEILIKQATYNGAKYLGVEKQFGSFEKGKKPGVVLIEGVSGQQLNFSSKSRLIK